MRLGARVSFDRLDELDAHLDGVDFPVELALPHRLDDFLPVAERMGEVREAVNARGVEVLSVHATQGRLSEDGHLRWARPALRLADELGASAVTFHPERDRRDRLHGQGLYLRHLGKLQAGARATAAVETFGGGDRVLQPEEIVDLDLPMVLDTAHLHDEARIHRLIRAHHRRIVTVHLSAKGPTEHHLPLDAACLEAVGSLLELGWEGGVVLEYLPWHHYRVRADLELLRRFVEGERGIEPPPPDDRHRNDPSRWGFTAR